MDEYNQGWDPDVRIYFRKILNSFVALATWMLFVAIAGLFFKLAYLKDGVHWYTIVFYAAALLSFLLLMLYFYRVWWRKK